MTRYLVVLLILLFTSVAANADLVFDRGLPTANLNDAAGVNRSNVAWGFPTPWDGYNWAVGDNFSLATGADVTDLRVWIVGADDQPLSYMWSDLTLFGGPDSSNINELLNVSTSGADPNVKISPVQYVGGVDYQNSSGGFDQIYQVDFLLNWPVLGGTTYDFFVGGTPTANNTNSDSPFLHASNAALSGSTQQGADNLMGYLAYDSSNDVVGWGTWDSNGDGWDKSSDINVQVITPEPSAITLLISMLGVVGLGVLGLRRRT